MKNITLRNGWSGRVAGRRMGEKASTELSTACLLSGPRAFPGRLVFGAAMLISAAIAAAAPPNAGADLARQAHQGDAWAQLNLGAAFDHGIAGQPIDPVQAVYWYRRAAEAGIAEAQFNLAHCLATGTGTPRDDAAALRWMLRAATQGLVDAQFLAGAMLAEGVGAAADRTAALLWLRRAAGGGHADAAVLIERLREGDAP
ncbi:MAG: sel1 repeat family protein [Gammaproteobacteria bacterium]|nr:sel1 repeat family protein [Gammaproteobacteria bacterium]